MTVSDKMIEAIHKVNISTCMPDPYTTVSGVDNPEEISQAVVNAAWCPFDPEDKSTWPPSKYCSSGLWLISFGRSMNVCSWTGNPNAWEDTIHYADPQDLMFKEVK